MPKFMHNLVSNLLVNILFTFWLVTSFEQNTLGHGFHMIFDPPINVFWGKLWKQSVIAYLPVSQNLKTACMRIAFRVWLEKTNKPANLQYWKARELNYLGKHVENCKKSSK